MKNKAKARDKKGPPPVLDGCPGCGRPFHSKFERKTHRCTSKARQRAASKPDVAGCPVCHLPPGDSRVATCPQRDCPWIHRRAA